MKKYFLMVAMMIATSISAFAESNEVNAFDNTNVEANMKKFEMKINQRRLACFLGMTVDQMENSDMVLKELESDMAFAGTMTSEDSSNKIVGNAVKKNLKWMHCILKEEQYKKYVMLLNLTLQNNGFEISEISK